MFTGQCEIYLYLNEIVSTIHLRMRGAGMVGRSGVWVRCHVNLVPWCAGTLKTRLDSKPVQYILQITVLYISKNC